MEKLSNNLARCKATSRLSNTGPLVARRRAGWGFKEEWCNALSMLTKQRIFAVLLECIHITWIYIRRFPQIFCQPKRKSFLDIYVLGAMAYCIIQYLQGPYALCLLFLLYVPPYILRRKIKDRPYVKLTPQWFSSFIFHRKYIPLFTTLESINYIMLLLTEIQGKFSKGESIEKDQDFNKRTTTSYLWVRGHVPFACKRITGSPSLDGIESKVHNTVFNSILWARI